MSGEVLILGVKGSGKTVFLSVLGHKYEGVGEFGLSLTPDRTTWNFAYECYHSMAPEDGSEQRFPKATDPNDDPVPLTWMVRAGTEPLFRMTTLECAGETMVKAFGGAGDEEAEERYSEEMTAAFDAIDAGSSAGIASKADTVTKLRAMAKRASVVCLFLNPRDFESQVAALPGWFRERLGRKLAQLREEGAGMDELRSAREASERALATARGELKDRYGSMLDLLRTFLENETYRGKRLVFVLTQTGGLERAIEEAGGAWGYINANIRQLEAFDLAGRAEAITVSAVDRVAPVEDEDGSERERPDGPIESTGLEDFLLTVGGACTPRLARLKEARRACLDAEQKSTDAVVDGEPLEIRRAAAKAWLDAALAWERAADRFVGEVGNVRAVVRQRTQAFAGADALRAERRWLAEDAMRERMVEDVASGTALDAGDLEGWLEVANGGVERKGLEPWTLDDLGLDSGWLAESLQARRERWEKLKRRFDGAIERLDWREALNALGETELEPYGVVRRSMERQAAEARRARAEMECRSALDGADELTAARKLGELAEAEEEAGPSEARHVLEEDLACLRSRLDVSEALNRVRAALKGVETGRAREKETLSAVAAALPRAASLLEAGEAEHGEENFRDLRQEWESCGLRLEKAGRRRTIRIRTQWALAAALLLAAAAAWVALRVLGDRELASVREGALDMAAAGDCEGARERLDRMKDKPWLALSKSKYATPDAYGRIEAYREYGEARLDMEKARTAWENGRAAMVREYGSESRCRDLGGDGWSDAEKAARDAEHALPDLALGTDGRPDPGQDLAAVANRYRIAGDMYKNAFAALERAKTAADQTVAEYWQERDALQKARTERENRRKQVAENAKREGIPVENLPEWKELDSAVRTARQTVPIPSGRELPASGDLKALAKEFRNARSAGDAVADQALDTLRKTVDARIAKAKVFAEADRTGLTDWEAAARAAKSSPLNADQIRSAKNLDSEWDKVLKAGKGDGAVKATPEEWQALGELLGSLLDNPSRTEEDRVFAEPRKAVCDAAGAYFAEKKRLKDEEAHKQAVKGRYARIDAEIKKRAWTEAAKLAEANLADARPGAEKADAEKKLRDIREQASGVAKAAVKDESAADADQLNASLQAAGYGTPELGESVSKAIREALFEKYPQNAPAGVPATYLRDAKAIEALAREKTDAQLMDARNEMVNRVKAWNADWLKKARENASDAAGNATAAKKLQSAWDSCVNSEAAANAVMGNPQATAAQREKAREILDSLPALVRLRAESAAGGRALEIREVKYDGVHSIAAGTAILAAGNDLGELASVEVEPNMGAARKVRFLFPRHGSKELTREF